MKNARPLRRIRLLLGLFVFCLVASGLTAFPLVWETRLLAAWFGEGSRTATVFPGLALWLSHVHEVFAASYGSYPFLAYGTDWLAFAHLVIAVVFLGPLKDPVKNIWVVEFGMIACVLVIPLALVCGAIRGIPWFWRLIDCSFGVFGLILLVIVWRRRDEKGKPPRLPARRTTLLCRRHWFYRSVWLPASTLSSWANSVARTCS